MKASNFPGCCGAAILAGFGGSGLADSHGMGENPKTKAGAKSWVNNQIRSHKASGYSQLIVIANNEQDFINAVMIALDEGDEFCVYSTPWLLSMKHERTLVKTWVIQLQVCPTIGKLEDLDLYVEEEEEADTLNDLREQIASLEEELKQAQTERPC